MSVVGLKLRTGEEIITKMDVNQVNGKYILTTPVLIVLRQDNPAFIPYMPYMKDPVEVDPSDVIIIGDPITEVENAYNQYFGSGIQIVQPSLIKG